MKAPEFGTPEYTRALKAAQDEFEPKLAAEDLADPDDQRVKWARERQDHRLVTRLIQQATAADDISAYFTDAEGYLNVAIWPDADERAIWECHVDGLSERQTAVRLGVGRKRVRVVLRRHLALSGLCRPPRVP